MDKYTRSRACIAPQLHPHLRKFNSFVPFAMSSCPCPFHPFLAILVHKHKLSITLLPIFVRSLCTLLIYCFKSNSSLRQHFVSHLIQYTYSMYSIVYMVVWNIFLFASIRICRFDRIQLDFHRSAFDCMCGVRISIHKHSLTHTHSHFLSSVL